MKHRKPRKIENKKVDKQLWCVDVLKVFPESSLPDKCCFNKQPLFTLGVPDEQEMNIAYSLDDIFDFQSGKRYKLSIEEIPWDDSAPEESN